MKQVYVVLYIITKGLTGWQDCFPQKLFVSTIESLLYKHTNNKLINAFKFIQIQTMLKIDQTKNISWFT